MNEPALVIITVRGGIAVDARTNRPLLRICLAGHIRCWGLPAHNI